jgi:hypothetical protein
MRILNNVLIYCEPLSQEEFDRMQEINALKSKLRKSEFD